MRTGLIVVCGFAAVWGAMALSGLGAPLWSWVAPVLVSGLLLWRLAPLVPTSSDRPPEERRRVGRLVMLWSGLEGLAALVAVNLLNTPPHARLIWPAVAVVVGLHFLPLARGLPFRPYYATGLAMVAAGLAACALPGTGPQAAASGAAALILWATALAFPRRGAPAAG